MRFERSILVLVLGLGMAAPALAQEKTRRLLVIGQSKGYQHDSVSTAMATLYNLGRSSGQWETHFRTDCTAITKKPLKWGNKNLDAFDAVVFFTDGDLDMDASQKADLLSFVRDDGKGFIGIHSAAITFLSLAGVRQDDRRILRRPSLGRVRCPAGRRGRGFPRACATCPARFTLKDEIYQIKDFSRDRVRVLLRLDAAKMDLSRKGSIGRTGISP